MSKKAADNDGYRINWPADRKITLVMQTKEPMKQATGHIKLESCILFRIPTNTNNAQTSTPLGLSLSTRLLTAPTIRIS